MSELEVATGTPGWAGAVTALVPGQGRARVVAVEGRSGAGKSTVAAHLAEVLRSRGEAVHVLTMEDLYAGWEGLAEGAELLRGRVLEPLARGEAPVWHRWDWEHGTFSTAPSSLPSEVARDGVLIVEGTGSGVRPGPVDLLVWVHAPDTVRARRLDRREDAHLYSPFRAAWAEQEARHLALHRPEEHARVRVDNG
ncbi:phosphoribulokinase [Nocardiopsis sp. HNM0947]|uniref:Phosphoribulokinase n=1 Tax=Nocardiopsis coralli TaxID=2772213 RepID=A0ABR9PEI3_9ACTN|nr:phosphoribulokinase [Nocardiopsis coralli]MBE3002135.1 phosphoribulokinase [Nocardiopsis coralli]